MKTINYIKLNEKMLRRMFVIQAKKYKKVHNLYLKNL